MATDADAESVQWLRKGAWRARYAHPSTGVTQAVLENELAALPPSSQDIAQYRALLGHPGNHGRNLVAESDGRVVGCLTYERTEDGVGYVGVFVAEGLNGTGVGDALLSRLIDSTREPLEVEIFARNPSREFYRRHGFSEFGSEFDHHFRAGIALPVQRMRLVR